MTLFHTNNEVYFSLFLSLFHTDTDFDNNRRPLPRLPACPYYFQLPSLSTYLSLFQENSEHPLEFFNTVKIFTQKVKKETEKTERSLLVIFPLFVISHHSWFKPIKNIIKSQSSQKSCSILHTATFPDTFI